VKRADNSTAFFIAWRYFFLKKRDKSRAKKPHNIQVIAAISTLGILVSSAALIIVLSAFNGLEGLIMSNVNAFNADLKIEPKEGKSFSIDSFPFEQIRQISSVKEVHEVVSDLTLLTYQDRQVMIEIKGVDATYGTDNQMDSIIIDGDYLLKKDDIYYGIVGAMAAGNIQLNLNSPEPLKLYYPQRNRKNLSNPANAFHTQLLYPAGVFMTYTEYDERFLFADIDFVRQLMDYEGECTSVEVLLKEKSDLGKVQNQIKKILGDKWTIRDRYQQEETLFKTMKSEKLMIVVILGFIMLLSTFNIIGTLGMLIVEKKRDIVILHNIGATKSFIKKVFLFEGLLVSMTGGMLGLVIGFTITLLQKTLHIVKLGNEGSHYIINYYPVELRLSDFGLVFLTLFIISLIVSIIPVKHIKINLKNLQR
jgi:ABC-type lipoprotein release transport system permease subunit